MAKNKITDLQAAPVESDLQAAPVESDLQAAPVKDRKKDVEVSPELKKIFDKTNEPKKRGRKKKIVKRKKGEIQISSQDESGVVEEVDIFFDETIGKYILNLYIEKVLKSKLAAQPDEVESFTKLTKSLFKKYLPEDMLDYQEEMNFIILIGTISLLRMEETK